MNPFPAYLHEQLEEKLKERRVVVWYDPNREFAPFVEALVAEVDEAAPDLSPRRKAGCGHEVVATLSRELGWSRFVELLPLKKHLPREFHAGVRHAEPDERPEPRMGFGPLQSRTLEKGRP